MRATRNGVMHYLPHLASITEIIKNNYMTITISTK
nr:MAG TPA: hypothetical protein [Bacteriophage sp.]